MRNFRQDRGRGFDRGRSGGNRFGGRGGGFGRDRDSFRRDKEMHDVVCTKCQKDCQVPFKPTGDKPVLCSDCFRQNGGNRNDRDNSSNNSVELGKINAKLDKIIAILQNLEIVEDEEFDDESDDEDIENNDDMDEEDSEDNDNVVYSGNEVSDSENEEEEVK